MAGLITLTTNQANLISATVLSAQAAGLLDAPTSQNYEGWLSPALAAIVRRPIQLSVFVTTFGPGLVALCDDGTIWYTTTPAATPAGWIQITSLPQT